MGKSYFALNGESPYNEIYRFLFALSMGRCVPIIMMNNAFWAKKKEKNGRLFWLPLAQHLEDVVNISGLLWEHWLGTGQKELIEKYLDDDFRGKGKNLVLFLAASHDLGKATPAFQTMKGYSNSEDLDIALLEKLEKVGFQDISSLCLVSSKCTPHNIASQFLLSTYGVAADLATIVGGHHGKPVDSEDEYKNQEAYKKNYFQSEDSHKEIYQRWDKEQKNIFKWALEVSGFANVKNLPKIKQPAQIIISGLLIMADWIASNEEYFPLLNIEENIVINKRERIEEGFIKWKKCNVWEAGYDVDFERTYKKRFGYKPRNVQSMLAQIIHETKRPGIYILEAPMGIGKTEAALVAAEQLAYKTQRNGIYFGLPTQATSNGIFPRILNWLKSIKEDMGENMAVRLSHGKAYLNDDFISLAKCINIDDSENESIIVNEWFSGKKTTSLDDFVVGTVDQFLMVALKQKHLALRHLGFSKKVVIIDEVHAYDAYMNQYLLEAIRWMGAYGVPVVVLSATLPEERRLQLVKNYMWGKGKTWNRKERKQLSQDLSTNKYPLITYNDGDEIKQFENFKKIENREVYIKKLKEEDLLENVRKMINEGGVVGLIVNTVKRAQELTSLFIEEFGEGFVELLHSGFIATDRIRKEKNLISMIGKDAERPLRKIIIGTQVIEQSLDIDFDVLISDLAPMDLLIQRIGRLHRHEVNRPLKHGIPKLYVLGTNDKFEFNDGSSVVYGEYLLARTQYFLKESIKLPEDISVLVQKVYGFVLRDKSGAISTDKDMDLIEDFTVKILKFKEKYGDKIKGKEEKANIYRILPPVLKECFGVEENLIGWLKNPTYNDSEEKACAQVRDINDSIEIIALKKIGKGYGLFEDNEDISAQISDVKIAKKVAQQTLTLPIVLSATYNIDHTISELEKYNLQFLKTWQESPWLKGSLGIIFDEKQEFILNNIKLKYSEEYGIMAERM